MQAKTQQQNYEYETESNEVIHDTQFDYYGKKVSTSSNKGKITIYEVFDNNKQNKTSDIKNAHIGSIWSISWSHPKYGSLIASGGIDKRVNIFKESKQNTWEKVFEYKEHKNSVNSVVFAPHEYGLILIASSSDGFISYHEYKNDNWVSQLYDAHAFGVTCLSWEPYTKDELSVRFVSGGNDNMLKIWSINRMKNTPERIFNLEGHTEAISDVAWFNDTNGKSTIASCGKDNMVYIWSFVDNQWNKAELMSFDCNISRINWSQCGNHLAVCLSNYYVYVFKENSESEWSIHCVINPEGGFETEKNNTDI